MLPSVPVKVSGDRFLVNYLITGDEAEARAVAEVICLEQTVELSDDMVPSGDIRQHIVGQIELLAPMAPHRYEARISYAVESSGFELVQLLSLIFSNSSMKKGIRVMGAEFPDSLLEAFSGPRFGRVGIRQRVGVPRRALLGTALKPMGYPPDKLAEAAYQFALGGLDIIKDDHGLADQSFAPFRERARQCAEAVQRANNETGGQALYVPNISGPLDQIVDKALYAREVGAGGVELYPGIVGYDALRLLAEDDRIDLPVFAHPALLGTYTVNPTEGLSHEFLFGQVMRLAGADVAIFSGHGGRFPTTAEDCRGIVRGTARPMGHLKPSLPMPGGGMTLDRVPELLDLYGNDVILLVSGGLYSIGPDLVANCRRFHDLVAESSS